MVAEHGSVSKIKVGMDASGLENVVGLGTREASSIAGGNEVESVDGVRGRTRRVR